MKTAMKSFFFVALSVACLFVGCGKDNTPQGSLPTDTPSAISYYKQFNFKRELSVPGVTGGAWYAQSPQLRLNVEGNYHAKLDLFLNDDNTFVLEYTEIQAMSENPVRGKLNGTVISGQWYVEGTELYLVDGTKKVAVGRAEIAPTGVRSIVMKMKVNLRDYNPQLKAEKLSDDLYFTFNKTSRILPSSLGDLKSEMDRAAGEGRTDQGFKD